MVWGTNVCVCVSIKVEIFQKITINRNLNSEECFLITDFSQKNNFILDRVKVIQAKTNQFGSDYWYSLDLSCNVEYKQWKSIKINI